MKSTRHGNMWHLAGAQKVVSLSAYEYFSCTHTHKEGKRITYFPIIIFNSIYNFTLDILPRAINILFTFQFLLLFAFIPRPYIDTEEKTRQNQINNKKHSRWNKSHVHRALLPYTVNEKYIWQNRKKGEKKTYKALRMLICVYRRVCIWVCGKYMFSADITVYISFTILFCSFLLLLE